MAMVSSGSLITISPTMGRICRIACLPTEEDKLAMTFSVHTYIGNIQHSEYQRQVYRTNNTGPTHHQAEW